MPLNLNSSPHGVDVKNFNITFPKNNREMVQGVKWAIRKYTVPEFVNVHTLSKHFTIFLIFLSLYKYST